LGVVPRNLHENILGVSPFAASRDATQNWSGLIAPDVSLRNTLFPKFINFAPLPSCILSKMGTVENKNADQSRNSKKSETLHGNCST
jgi:hypothetical protein